MVAGRLVDPEEDPLTVRIGQCRSIEAELGHHGVAVAVRVVEIEELRVFGLRFFGERDREESLLSRVANPIGDVQDRSLTNLAVLKGPDPAIFGDDV